MSDDWREQAACLGCDPDLFFPQRYDVGNVNAAKAVCFGCPVRSECLDEYLWEDQGIFGGTSAKERRKLRKGKVRPIAAIPHGTRMGYETERRRGLEPCEFCKLAHTLYRSAQRTALRLVREAS